jgi:hypothetical protein
VSVRRSRQTHELQRARENGRTRAKQTAWYRYWRARVVAGIEPCRRCGRRGERFGHLIAHVNGGPYKKHNLTILCGSCDDRNADNDITDLPSLADEESVLGFYPSPTRLYPPDPREDLANW